MAWQWMRGRTLQQGEAGSHAWSAATVKHTRVAPLASSEVAYEGCSAKGDLAWLLSQA